MQTYNCPTPNNNQKWTAKASGSYFTLTNGGSGHCLTASGTTSGSGVTSAVCNGATSQQWQAVAVAGIAGAYTLAPASATGLALATSTPTANQSTVTTNTLAASSNTEQWTISAIAPPPPVTAFVSGTAYNILTAAAGTGASQQCLDNWHASAEGVQTYNCPTPNTNQKWTATSAGAVAGYVFLHNVGNSNHCLVASGTTSGSGVTSAACTTATSMQWKLVATGTAGVLNIVPASASGLALYTASPTGNTATVTTNTASTTSSNMQWVVVIAQ